MSLFDKEFPSILGPARTSWVNAVIKEDQENGSLTSPDRVKIAYGQLLSKAGSLTDPLLPYVNIPPGSLASSLIHNKLLSAMVTDFQGLFRESEYLSKITEILNLEIDTRIAALRQIIENIQNEYEGFRAKETGQKIEQVQFGISTWDIGQVSNYGTAADTDLITLALYGYGTNHRIEPFKVCEVLKGELALNNYKIEVDLEPNYLYGISGYVIFDLGCVPTSAPIFTSDVFDKEVSTAPQNEGEYVVIYNDLQGEIIGEQLQAGLVILSGVVVLKTNYTGDFGKAHVWLQEANKYGDPTDLIVDPTDHPPQNAIDLSPNTYWTHHVLSTTSTPKYAAVRFVFNGVRKVSSLIIRINPAYKVTIAKISGIALSGDEHEFDLANIDMRNIGNDIRLTFDNPFQVQGFVVWFEQEHAVKIAFKESEYSPEIFFSNSLLQQYIPQNFIPITSKWLQTLNNTTKEFYAFTFNIVDAWAEHIKSYTNNVLKSQPLIRASVGAIALRADVDTPLNSQVNFSITKTDYNAWNGGVVLAKNKFPILPLGTKFPIYEVVKYNNGKLKTNFRAHGFRAIDKLNVNELNIDDEFKRLNFCEIEVKKNGRKLNMALTSANNNAVVGDYYIVNDPGILNTDTYDKDPYTYIQLNDEDNNKRLEAPTTTQTDKDVYIIKYTPIFALEYLGAKIGDWSDACYAGSGLMYRGNGAVWSLWSESIPPVSYFVTHVEFNPDPIHEWATPSIGQVSLEVENV